MDSLCMRQIKKKKKFFADFSFHLTDVSIDNIREEVCIIRDHKQSTVRDL